MIELNENEKVNLRKYCQQYDCDFEETLTIVENLDLNCLECAKCNSNTFVKKDKARQMASQLQERQRTLAKIFPQDVAVNLAASEVALGKQPEQPQPKGLSQIEKCEHNKVATCPHPDCFFRNICSITKR